MAKFQEGAIRIIRWMVATLRDDIARTCAVNSPTPEILTYTNAATYTRIVASLFIDVDEFGEKGAP